jgi:hypothetical protein
MSGQKYRTLINTLIETLDRPRYLEIGSWLDWSQFSGTKEQFLANIKKAKSNSSEFHLIERDFREIDYRALGKFNVYLFDGPHTLIDHRDGILVVQPCLADRFVLIVDDWNWRSGRTGTMRGLLAAKCQIGAS